MPRKPTINDLNYMDDKLSVVRQQMDSIRAYLDTHSWQDIEDDDKRQKEFKLQKELTDSLISWSDRYTELSGILDVYRQMEAMKGNKSLKSGQQVSGVQIFVRNFIEKQAEKAKKENKK